MTSAMVFGGLRGIVKEIFLGSTSHYVVQKSKVPVVVVK